jgi:hypothetical protein
VSLVADYFTWLFMYANLTDISGPGRSDWVTDKDGEQKRIIILGDPETYAPRYKPPQYECNFSALLSMVDRFKDGKNIAQDIVTVATSPEVFKTFPTEFKLDSTGKVVSVLETEILRTSGCNVLVNPSRGTFFRAEKLSSNYTVFVSKKYNKSAYFGKFRDLVSKKFPIEVKKVKEFPKDRRYFLGTRGHFGHSIYSHLNCIGLELNPIYGSSLADVVLDVRPTDDINVKQVCYRSKHMEEFMDYFEKPVALRYHPVNLFPHLCKTPQINLFNIVTTRYKDISDSVKLTNLRSLAMFSPLRVVCQAMSFCKTQELNVGGNKVDCLVGYDEFGDPIDLVFPALEMSSRFSVMRINGINPSHKKPYGNNMQIIVGTSAVRCELPNSMVRRGVTFSVMVLRGNFDRCGFVPAQDRREGRRRKRKKKKNPVLTAFKFDYERYWYMYTENTGKIRIGRSELDLGDYCGHLLCFYTDSKGVFEFVVQPTSCMNITLFPTNLRTDLVEVDVVNAVENEPVSKLTLEACLRRDNGYDSVLQETLLYPTISSGNFLEVEIDY